MFGFSVYHDNATFPKLPITFTRKLGDYGVKKAITNIDDFVSHIEKISNCNLHLSKKNVLQYIEDGKRVEFECFGQKIRFEFMCMPKEVIEEGDYKY